MGQFSWLDCKTEEQIVDNYSRDVYVLVPKDFGGGHIKETCYDGYGHFGAHDIYDLVADWNKGFIPNVLAQKQAWKCSISEKDEENLKAFAAGNPIDCEKRWLGIILACYDEDNERLMYPIKITHDANASYEACGISKSDPYQGWPPEEDEFEDEWDDYDDGYDEVGYNPYMGGYDYDC